MESAIKSEISSKHHLKTRRYVLCSDDQSYEILRVLAFAFNYICL
jgi:hypothetical protein